MPTKKTIYGISTILITVFYTTGLIGISFSPYEQWFINQTPWLILLGFMLLMLNHHNWSWQVLLVMTAVLILGFTIEAIGVSTGKIFGLYQYGDTLGRQLYNTPILIGINWLTLVYCVYIILQPISIPVSLKSLLGGLILTIFDLNMEPIAVQMNMWTWDFIDVPMLNYIAWFALSAIFLLAFYKTDREQSGNLFAAYYFSTQLLFFFLLHLFWL